MTEKKMTTGGFFRALFRHALGGDGENPVHTVIKKGLQANGEAKVIEVEAEEGTQEARNPKHEGA
jgi:DNA-binding winged helix-turn-helix (wHTH) protein